MISESDVEKAVEYLRNSAQEAGSGTAAGNICISVVPIK